MIYTNVYVYIIKIKILIVCFYMRVREKNFGF